MEKQEKLTFKIVEKDGFTHEGECDRNSVSIAHNIVQHLQMNEELKKITIWVK